MPAAIKKTLTDILFGGTLFDLKSNLLYEFSLPCGIYLCAVALPESDGFILTGPYLSEREQSDTLDELLTLSGVSLTEKETYSSYLESLPLLSHQQLYVVFRALYDGIYNIRISRDFHEIKFSYDCVAPCPVWEEDTLQIKAELIEKRYQLEQQFLDAVLEGDFDAAYALTIHPFGIDRVPNKLRNEKNLLIVLNTLLRKNLQRAHVHPFYIDTISTKWAVRIEAISKIGQINELNQDMVRDYCMEVCRHSLTGYTPNVRAMLNFINFSLNDTELSLQKIARHLNANPSYLSQQFNREVGQSLPEYIAQNRIAQAKRLLSSHANLSIGQIAYATGFADVNYFTKVFKKITGDTPTAFRRREVRF